MTRKTESLAYPADPLASIRELQQLNAPPDAGQSGASDLFPAPGPRTGLRQPSPPQSAAPLPTPAARSAVANTGGSAGSSVTSSEEVSAPRPRPRKPANRPK